MRIGRPSAEIPSIPSSSGRWSGTRSITMVIRIRPADSAESTSPQPCSPNVSSATVGPRMKIAPEWMALRAQKAITTTHSQVVCQK